MPNQEPGGDLPGPEQGEGGTAPTSSKTIRLADLKNRAAGKVGTNATPAIKPIKVILALPSRPAPEAPDTAPQRERASSPVQPKAKKSQEPSGAAAAASRGATPVPTASPAPTPSKKPAPPAKTASAAATKAQSPNATPSSSLTAATLPLAVGELFALNNYDVEYGQKIHGAEVDIIATPKGGAFGSTIYLEVTVQYVDNTKYGKDLTKFMLMREMDRDCVCISVSTSGFTPDVRERARPREGLRNALRNAV